MSSDYGLIPFDGNVLNEGFLNPVVLEGFGLVVGSGIATMLGAVSWEKTLSAIGGYFFIGLEAGTAAQTFSEPYIGATKAFWLKKTIRAGIPAIAIFSQQIYNSLFNLQSLKIQINMFKSVLISAFGQTFSRLGVTSLQNHVGRIANVISTGTLGLLALPEIKNIFNAIIFGEPQNAEGISWEEIDTKPTKEKWVPKFFEITLEKMDTINQNVKCFFSLENNLGIESYMQGLHATC